MFVQLEYDVGCGKVGLQPYLFLFSAHKKRTKKCTQECIQVYTKMYSSVHKNVQRRTQKAHRVMHFPPLPHRYKTGLNSI